MTVNICSTHHRSDYKVPQNDPPCVSISIQLTFIFMRTFYTTKSASFLHLEKATLSQNKIVFVPARNERGKTESVVDSIIKTEQRGGGGFLFKRTHNMHFI